MPLHHREMHDNFLAGRQQQSRQYSQTMVIPRHQYTKCAYVYWACVESILSIRITRASLAYIKLHCSIDVLPYSVKLTTWSWEVCHPLTPVQTSILFCLGPQENCPVLHLHSPPHISWCIFAESEIMRLAPIKQTGSNQAWNKASPMASRNYTCSTCRTLVHFFISPLSLSLTIQ